MFLVTKHLTLELDNFWSKHKSIGQRETISTSRFEKETPASLKGPLCKQKNSFFLTGHDPARESDPEFFEYSRAE